MLRCFLCPSVSCDGKELCFFISKLYIHFISFGQLRNQNWWQMVMCLDMKAWVPKNKDNIRLFDHLGIRYRFGKTVCYYQSIMDETSCSYQSNRKEHNILLCWQTFNANFSSCLTFSFAVRRILGLKWDVSFGWTVFLDLRSWWTSDRFRVSIFLPCNLKCFFKSFVGDKFLMLKDLLHCKHTATPLLIFFKVPKVDYDWNS